MSDWERTRLALHDDVPALPAGYRLGRYELCAVLARTETEIVYEARDHELQRVVAAREFVPAELALRWDGIALSAKDADQQAVFDRSLRNFVAEVRKLAADETAGKLRRIHDFIQANGTAYAITPLDEKAPIVDATAQNARTRISASEPEAQQRDTAPQETPTQRPTPLTDREPGAASVRRPPARKRGVGLAVWIFVGAVCLLGGGGYAAWQAVETERMESQRQLEAEAAARLRAEQLAAEQAQLAAEIAASAEARRLSDEQARQKAAAEALATEQRRRQAAELEAKRRSEEEAERRRLEAEERRKAEADARRQAEEKRLADEAQRKPTEQDEVRRRVEQARGPATAPPPASAPPQFQSKPSGLPAAEANAYVAQHWPAIRQSTERYLRANPALVAIRGYERQLGRIQGYSVVEVTATSVMLQVRYDAIERSSSGSPSFIETTQRTFTYANTPPGFPVTGN